MCTNLLKNVVYDATGTFHEFTFYFQTYLYMPGIERRAIHYDNENEIERKMRTKKNGKRWGNKSVLLLCHFPHIFIHLHLCTRTQIHLFIKRQILCFISMHYIICSHSLWKFACNRKHNKTLSKAVYTMLNTHTHWKFNIRFVLQDIVPQ